MADAVYSRDQVERWQVKLEKIAVLPRTTFTKKQVVEELIEAIEKALETRSYDEVAQALAMDGLEISAGSLKQYVSKYRRAQKTKPVATGRKRTAKAKKESVEGRSMAMTTANDSAQAESPETAMSTRKSKRFIEMDEEL